MLPNSGVGSKQQQYPSLFPDQPDDFVKVFGGPEKASDPIDRKRDGQVGRFHGTQFLGIQPVPIDCSPALNLIGVHPALIAFAKAALNTDEVHLYQCQAWIQVQRTILPFNKMRNLMKIVCQRKSHWMIWQS